MKFHDNDDREEDYENDYKITNVEIETVFMKVFIVEQTFILNYH